MSKAPNMVDQDLIASLTDSQEELLLERLRSVYAGRNSPAPGPDASASTRRLAVYLTLEDNAQPQTREQIEQHLKERLPHYMLPSSISILDRLPTTPNGKIDKAALSRLPNHFDRHKLSSPPRSDGCLEALLEIWERTLGITGIRETDDFFELGGDSILAIQIVSEARKAGLPLSVSQLFKHPTPKGLASCLVPDSSTKAPAKTSVTKTAGDLSTVPFTPIQKWFFENRLLNPDHWNQSLLLKIPPEIPFARIESAFRLLYESHDALRLTIHQGPTSIHQSIPEASAVDLPIQHRRLLPREVPGEAAIICETAIAIHTNLRLSEGRLLRASFFSADNDEPNKLLLIAHHLCVDAVSWKIILDDLARHLGSRLDSEPREPALTAGRFALWASALEEEAAAASLESSLDFWRNQQYDRCPGVPLDQGDLAQNLEASTRTHCVSLSEHQTQLLLAKASTREQSVQTFLVASLALTLGNWLGSRSVLLGIEGHGRNDLASGAHSDGIVGWLTAYFPVVLDLQFADSPEQALSDIRFELSQVPDNGRSFGLLRYSHPDPAVRDCLAALRQPEVTFNYLGKVVGASAGSPFSVIDYRIGVDRDPGNRRTCLFEINARIVEDRLKVDWQYSERTHSPATIQTLAQSFAATLDRLVSSPATILPAAPDVQADVERSLPLTDGQQALLLHHLGSQGNDLGELTLSGDLVGSVSLDRLRAAWDKLVARHPALRATAHWSHSAAPMLKIHRTSGAAVETVDLSHLPDSEQRTILAGLVEQLKRRPLDIQQLPTTRVMLVKRSEERHTFIWRCHHLFLDGWSSTLVMQELLAQLDPSTEAAADQTNASPAFYEYHDWVASIPPCQPGRFWSEYMRGCPPCLMIENVRDTRAKQGPQQRSTIVHQPQHLSLGALRSAAARYRTTPAAIGIASWAIVLANLTQRQSVCFGIACSGRNAPISNPGVVVGNLSNLVPLRAHCDSGSDISNWLRDLVEQQDRVSRHAHVSTVRIANWSTTGSESPFFDTTLAIANYPWVDPSRAVRLEDFAGDTTSTYPVSVSLSLNPALALWIDYDARMLSTDVARHLASLYAKTLARLCDEPSPTWESLLNAEIAPEFQRLVVASRRNHGPPPPDTAVDRNESPVQQRSHTTEERLLALLRETLSTPDCGPDDNFFELGGTSMHAVRLFNAIEKSFLKRLPVSVLFRYPTASSLSLLLQSSSPSTQSYGSLVEIQRGDVRFPPLFLIHAGGLEVLFYKQLADSLDPQLPVYGLLPVGLDGTEPPLDDIRAIAGRYVTEIRGVHPRSPYFLLGHCFGVTIAFEMAAQLTNRNFNVPLLISLDGPAPRTIPGLELPSTIPKPAFFKRVAGRLRREAAARQETWRYRHGDPETRREVIYKRITRAYLRAVRHHTAQRYLGHVVHFKARDSEDFANHSDLAWKQAVPKVEIHTMDCGHSEILQRPHVTSVANAIVNALNVRYFRGELRNATAT